MTTEDCFGEDSFHSLDKSVFYEKLWREVLEKLSEKTAENHALMAQNRNLHDQLVSATFVSPHTLYKALEPHKDTTKKINWQSVVKDFQGYY